MTSCKREVMKMKVISWPNGRMASCFPYFVHETFKNIMLYAYTRVVDPKFVYSSIKSLYLWGWSDSSPWLVLLSQKRLKSDYDSDMNVPTVMTIQVIRPQNNNTWQMHLFLIKQILIFQYKFIWQYLRPKRN